MRGFYKDVRLSSAVVSFVKLIRGNVFISIIGNLDHNAQQQEFIESPVIFFPVLFMPFS